MKARMVRLLLVAMVGILALAGCEVLPEELPTPTPIPVQLGSKKPTYEVKRGTIVSVIKALGRVAAQREETYFFRQSGRLKALYATYNQKVKKGDVLAELETGLLDTQIAQAEVDVQIAELRVEEAKAAKPELAQLKQAEAGVASAEASLEMAKANLAKLQGGPTADQVRAAEARVASAQENLSAAEARLSSLQNGPKPEDIRAAELELEQAKASLHSTQVRRDAACGSKKDGNECKSAQAEVLARINGVDIAQARLDAVKAPASPDDLKTAQDAVTSARASLAAAQAGLITTRAGAPKEEIAAAQKTVESAEQALESAEARLELEKAKVEPTANHALQILEKQVEKEKLSLLVLQRQADEARIVAPFDGVVVGTNGRAGELIQAFQEVVTLADPAGLEVRVDLTPVDLARCAPGQDVTLTIQSYPGRQIKGKVIELPTNEPGAVGAAEKKSVRISFESPGPGAKLSDTANVTIVVEKREDVLVIPLTTVRSFGDRVFVQVIEGDRKREVDVKVGLRDDEHVEIESGLKEGQVVVEK